MKVQRDDRVLRLTGIEHEVNQLDIALSYLGQTDARKAQALDKVVIPAIEKALDPAAGYFMVDEPMTPEKIDELFPDGQIEVVVPLSLGQIACSSTDETYDGLNDLMDEYILGFAGSSLMNLSFKAIGVVGDFVLVLVNADASHVLDEWEADLEQTRRDEKRGLYYEHEDPSN